MCDSSVSQITDLGNFDTSGQNPQNAVWVEYNAGATATHWFARHKTGGTVQAGSQDTGIALVTGRQWRRFGSGHRDRSGKRPTE